jgi:hypothetical protein|tara:strand:- start:1262 stop:1588 length:327 start_codon:yes stop_codon:yes gene_type:complete
MARNRIRIHTGNVVTQTALAIRESRKHTECRDKFIGERPGEELSENAVNCRLMLLDGADDEMTKLVDVLYEQINRVQDEMVRIMVAKKSLQKLALEGATNKGEEVTNG